MKKPIHSSTHLPLKTLGPTLVFCLMTCYFFVRAQEPVNQFGVGLTRSFIPVNKMIIGKVGLMQIPQATIWLDYTRRIQRSEGGLYWGTAASIGYEKFFYDIDRPLPYYIPEKNWYVFLAAGIRYVELHGYLGKRWMLQASPHTRLSLAGQLGPVFHVNPYPNYTEASGATRLDGNDFRLYVIDFERPAWYVPYLRGTVSLEFTKLFKSGFQIGISPQLSVAAFSQDESLFTTVPEDLVNRSVGTFKINRGFYGCKLILGK